MLPMLPMLPMLDDPPETGNCCTVRLRLIPSGTCLRIEMTFA